MDSAEGEKMELLSCNDCPELCSVRKLLAKVTYSQEETALTRCYLLRVQVLFALKWPSNGVKLLANGRA